ncbi:MAG TPA: glycosyltransferase family 1 protein [Verrucomicrobiae bacterium]|nr:glycosyltransferase family 1 protein [Verrucomicrobiae bacterium]
MRVIHFQRRPADGQVSIERVFNQLRAAMPAGIHCSAHISPCFSRGILPRLANILDARAHCAQLNHIVGDSHYLALALDPTRTILTVHDCAPLLRLRGPKRFLVRWFWFELPLRRAAIVTAISDATRRELARLLPRIRRPVRVVHNCLPTHFRPEPKPFNQHDPLLLQVGTAPNKNLERLILAMAGLPCRLRIIGKLGPQHLRLLRSHAIQYDNLPRATEAELIESYRQSDAVLFASTYEGFGLPILEANAIGRPVLTGNCLSMPEVAGPAACLVDPYDAGSIRQGLVRIISDSQYRQRLVGAGFQNVKRFSPKSIAAQYAAIYRELQGNVA